MKITHFPVAIVMIIAMTQPAFAYLDPGAGSFMLQMLIAGVMSALFAIKMYWYRLKAWIAGLSGKAPPVQDEQDEDSPAEGVRPRVQESPVDEKDRAQ